ncbi:hypothetical protein ABMA70_12865 [Halobacteriovorax sp. XZX-3]|uniref:hypothetical protein n=1 Tax=unclassified Halobacteriovorax TaxID=2639665 RepID=UPI00371B9E0D
MNLKEIFELNELYNEIVNNKLYKRLTYLKEKSYHLSQGTDNQITSYFNEAIELKVFLELLNSSSYISKLIKSFGKHELILNAKSFTDTIDSHIRVKENSSLNKFYDEIEEYLDYVTSYFQYHSTNFDFNETSKFENNLIFTIDVNKSVYLNKSYNKLKNISEILELVKNISNENIDFEITHVEDGSMKVVICATFLIVNIVSPIISTVSKHFNEIMEISNKNEIHKVKLKIEEEKLRHLKKMNQYKEQEKETLLNEVRNLYKDEIEELIKLKQEETNEKIKRCLTNLDCDLKYKKREIVINNKSHFEEPNKEMIIDKITKKIITHYKEGGFVEVLKLEYMNILTNTNAEVSYLEYSKKLESLSEETMKMLELIDNSSDTDDK